MRYCEFLDQIELMLRGVGTLQNQKDIADRPNQWAGYYLKHHTIVTCTSLKYWHDGASIWVNVSDETGFGRTRWLCQDVTPEWALVALKMWLATL